MTRNSLDRFMRVACRHAVAGCSRSAVRTRNGEQHTTCEPCSREETRACAVLRGCIACSSVTSQSAAPVINAVLAGSCAHETSGVSTEHEATVASMCGSTESQAATAPAATPMMDPCEEFEHHLATVTASLQRMLVIDPGYMNTADQAHTQAVIRRLSYSPGDVHSDVHMDAPMVAAIPTMVVCSRCERGGHKRAGCRGVCAACGHAWPECDPNCPMRYDESTELMLAISDSNSPAIQTTDLDTGVYTPLTLAGGVVGASTSTQVNVFTAPDEVIIAQYADTMRDRFMAKFPKVAGLTPSQWMPLATAGQHARLCRAVGTVVQAMQRHTVPGADAGMIRWDNRSQAEIRGAHRWLRDEVTAVSDNVLEVIATMWDI